MAGQDLTALRDAAEKLSDMLTPLFSDLATPNPKPETIKAMTQIAAKFGLGLAPPDTAQPDDEDEKDPNVDADGVPLSYAKRREKRDRAQFLSGFNGFDRQQAQKRAAAAKVVWPSDMSAGRRESVIQKTLGSRAPKGRG
jgi:hypothetical protein